MRGQNRPPPSGGVASANPQRALTAKDIKVIMNNPSDANRETPEILTRKDSKLGRKDKLQMSEKEAAQMTKSKGIKDLTLTQIILTNLYFPPLQVSMCLMPRQSSRWMSVSVPIPWTVSAQLDIVVPCLMTRTLIYCNHLCGVSSTVPPGSCPNWE